MYHKGNFKKDTINFSRAHLRIQWAAFQNYILIHESDAYGYVESKKSFT